MSRIKGDEIVISGISGCFPDTDNTQELKEKLYSKIDMVTKSDEFAHIKHYDLPKHSGKIKNMDKFDAQFFRVTHWQAATLDPVGRKLMEHTFSAIFDAGINPETLKGARLGVFISSAQSDAGTLSLYDILKHNGFILSGASKAMLANRISYWVDGVGPSYGFDYGCAGAMASLEMAYNRMKCGEIDYAIVGGSNFCILPVLSVNMKRAGLLCLDGKTKCFDKHGDGYVRSDAINILFLQKAKGAKRIYSEVYHVKGKYFAAPDASFLPTRNPRDLEKFFEEFYSEIDVSAEEVEYVEANAFGIADADGNELEAIGNIFAKNKTVKVGSIKSNMGNTEGASGACSLTKMCLAYQKGQIPANLHYSSPQNHIPAVKDGRLQVVTEHAPFNRKFTAINNFCFMGGNFHALLKGHYKPKDTERYKSTIPRLVLVSGRQENSVNAILDKLETSTIDPEQYALLNNFFKYNVPGYTGRGYTILDANEKQQTVSLARGFEFYSGNTRPVWFLYSGMGSQWAGMGEGLLRLPVFAAAMEKCNKILLPRGLDIIKIITDKNNESLNILNSLVAITAIQIGLTDVLKSIGIVPDHIIGHSVGELASAYADESLSAEKTMLASYSRAIVSYETKFIKGKMAAIGLGHTKIAKICPHEIQIACHNSSDSSTISGPADIMTEFIKSLTEQGIFAREVASSNIAFHSKYIAKAGPDFLARQKQFITEPKLRSEKWVSTCYLPEDWHKPESKYASAEYFTRNLLGSVLFEEAAKLIPDDAIIIEIAPHGLLQAIMKRSHSACMNLSLTRRGEKDSVKLLLESIGKLYEAGVNPDLDALYPQVEFPVSTETPLLSHFIGWEHSADWVLDKFIMEETKEIKSKEFVFSIQDDEFTYLQDHIRSGSIVLPEAAILVFVWETLATYKKMDYRDMSVVFDDMNFYNEVVIKPDELLKINVTIQCASSKFEVVKDGKVLADGVINEIEKSVTKCGNLLFSENEKHLNQNDIYTLLNTRGYSYEGGFQSIKETNIERTKATLKWNDQWITFLDSLFQFCALSKDHDGVSTVKLINKLTINLDEHKKLRSKTSDNDYYFYDAIVIKNIGETKCGGVILKDIIFNEIPKTDCIPKFVKTQKFIPYNPAYEVDFSTALFVNLQVLKENVTSDVLKIQEIVCDGQNTISNVLKQLAKEIPYLKIITEAINCYQCYEQLDEIEMSNSEVLIFQNVLENKIFGEIISRIGENTYILTVEEKPPKTLNIQDMKTVTVMHSSNKTIILMKKAKKINMQNIQVISTQTNRAISIDNLKKDFYDKDIMLVIEKETFFSFQCILREVKKYNNIFLFVIDAKSPKFMISNTFYQEQIQKGLKINILENGQWGNRFYVSVSAQFKGIKNKKLIATGFNNFESLTWVEAPVESDKKTIKICYSGLSTKDCKNLSETNSENKCFGLDFSGIDCNGNRVMGLLPRGAMASRVDASDGLLWPVPQHWSLEEAATVPLPYMHALYCLVIRSSLSQKSNVLVTGAAGALGQAVIAVAQSLDCTVFATVATADKKRFLLKLFPGLDENNIGYTYDNLFREMVISRTNNERCSVVINCASGEIRKAAMGCIGFMKNFLDVNDSNYRNNDEFQMACLAKARSYKSVNVASIFSAKYVKLKKSLQLMLSEGIAKGFVRPLSSTVFIPSDISRAFRLISNRNNRGRVLINMNDTEFLKDGLHVTPRLTLSAAKTNIVVCDGTDLSIELMDYLVQRGARNILIHCEPKRMNGYFHVKYASWRKQGVRIEFSSGDLKTENSCHNLIINGQKTGPVEGIFIAQKDFGKENDKIIGGEFDKTVITVSNLDKAFRKCNELRFFAVIVATSHNSSNKYALEEIEECCLLRYNLGVPSLYIRHIMNNGKLQPNTLSVLFNGMESSIHHKYGNVLTSDLTDKNIDEALTSKMNTNFNCGLEAFLSHILKDDFAATEPIVQMKTKTNLWHEHELLIKPDNTYLIMIPGMEGNYEVFSSISERLKISATTLQLCPNINESIPKLAQKLYKFIKTRLHLQSPFYLMGYSFGVNVALELAALLEKDGLVGSVYCLDSSPDAMRVHLDAYIGKLTDEELQNCLIQHFFKLLAGQDPTAEFQTKLNKTISWSEKVDVIINEIKNYVAHTHGYLTDLLQAVYGRIKMAKAYKPKFNLESELVLIKGVPHPNADQLSDDYNLSQYTNKPVQVFEIQSDHALAPFDCKVSNYINRTLAL